MLYVGVGVVIYFLFILLLARFLFLGLNGDKPDARRTTEYKNRSDVEG